MRRSAHAGAALAAVVTLGAAAAGCGGGGGDSSSPASWKKEHSTLVGAFSRDLSDAINNINQGQRETTVASCTQVSETAKEVKKDALPAPDSAVDLALQSAVDNSIKGGDNCLKGARETNARAVEEAQRNFAEARKALDQAETAIQAISS